LATTTQTYGDGPTRTAYHQLKTRILEGEVVASPMRFWAKVAQAIRDNPQKPKAKPSHMRRY
jgi:hypothetical protein